MKNTTDGTERLLFVGRLIRDGGEAELKEAVERNFPAHAFERCGIVGFTSHVGGGYCVLEFGFEEGFDSVFGRLAKDPDATKFLDVLSVHVVPPPRIVPGRTADQPLAADQFLWRAGGGTSTRGAQAGAGSAG